MRSLHALAAMLVVGCDASPNTPCVLDADCVDPGEPVCDAVLDICVPARAAECAVDVDCQIRSGCLSKCAANSECIEGDRCVVGFGGQGYCCLEDEIDEADPADDDACSLSPGFVSQSLADTGGNNIDVCIAETGSCDAAGACVFE